MPFERFINRVVINAKLVAVTPIFIGAQADSLMPNAINGSCLKDVYVDHIYQARRSKVCCVHFYPMC